MNRRQFVHTAAAGAIPLEIAAESPAQQPAARPNDPGVLCEALLEFAKNRYGRHLTDEQTRALRARILRNLGSAAILRAVPLTNADEPDTNFVAD